MTFVGDNGQGDESLARVLTGPDTNENFFSRGSPPKTDKLRRLRILRQHTRSAWIHDVKNSGTRRRGVREYGQRCAGAIVYFRDYGDAARVALKRELITWDNFLYILRSIDEERAATALAEGPA